VALATFTRQVRKPRSITDMQSRDAAATGGTVSKASITATGPARIARYAREGGDRMRQHGRRRPEDPIRDGGVAQGRQDGETKTDAHRAGRERYIALDGAVKAECAGACLVAMPSCH
jgi:hypothetical protein